MGGRVFLLEKKRYMRNMASRIYQLKKKDNDYKRSIKYGLKSNGDAHKNIKNYLSVKQSTIPRAGKGVFANKAFKKGIPIILVCGQVVDVYYRNKTRDKYCFLLENYKRLVLELFHDDRCNICKYINSHKRKQNVVIYNHGPLLFVYSLKQIKRGDELFLDYSIR